ncbi:hypothetical protein E2C01_091027 [Portunus trituberculatus]|uniref:Uncharacterized protein n=1 Tax=Portunus trituberculatus TaxID=210409 RepID=A0A5B7JCX4_PORTR|nr:hypothetical protein [Portunus trituberculatus]
MVKVCQVPGLGVACGGLGKKHLSTAERGWLVSEGLSSLSAVTSTHKGEVEAAERGSGKNQTPMYCLG